MAGKIIPLGPFGGTGGVPWDDGSSYTGVREIHLSHKEAIRSFQVIYDQNGNPSPGPPHPAGDATFTNEKCIFTYPEETLKSVNGFIDSVSKDDPQNQENLVVTTITFTTNKGTYGPYGPQTGFSFNAQVPDGGQVVGFFGRSDTFLHAIGLYVKVKN